MSEVPLHIYRAYKGSNPNYWVHIRCLNHRLEVICDLPEQLSIGISSEWESLLPYSLTGLLEKVVGNTAPAAGAVLGVSPQVQSLSFQMWTGTSPIEIPITVLFDAEESAQRDVYEPINYLQSLVLPVNGSWVGQKMLMPPGPIWGGERGYGIDIKLGRFAFFKDCIMVSANATMDSRLDAAGYPISGQVECTFRTSYVYGHKDFLTSMTLKNLSDVDSGEGYPGQ